MTTAEGAGPNAGGSGGGSSPWQGRLLAGRDPVESWRPASGGGRAWNRAEVVAVVPETPDCVTLQMRVGDPEPFLPGQHFILRVPVAGRPPVQRTFSAGSSPYPDPAVVDITVREDPAGLVSPVLVRRVPVGAELDIEGPYGMFTWTEADGGPVGMVAGGAGIVPLMSMLRYAAARRLDVPIRLLYSSPDADHAIYRAALDDLAGHHRWLDVAHTFTRDPTDSRARFHRRVDAAMVEQFFGPDPGAGPVYICGSPDFVATARTALTATGVAEGRVLSEEWT